MGDTRELAAWLRQQGTPEETIDELVPLAERVLALAGAAPARILPKHVDAALREAERRGDSPQELAALQRAGDVLVRFGASQPRSMPPPMHVEQPPRPLADLTHDGAGAARCPWCRGIVALEYGQQSSRALGGIAGLATMASGFFCGCLGASAGVLLAGGGAMLAGGLVCAQRCTSCGKKPPSSHLTPDQRRELWMKRLQLLGGGGVLFSIGAGLAVFWWNLNRELWHHRFGHP